MINELWHGDCLELMQDIPDNSIDLILTDPPYFKVKKDSWDRQWDKPKEFLSWLDTIAEQWQRILKPNGSLYCFASPKMAARVEVMLGERFNVVNRITWNKGDLPTGGRHKSACKDILRGFFYASESIIFCEHYGADNIAKGEAGYGAKCDELRGFVFEPLRAYLDGERQRAGVSRKELNYAFSEYTNKKGCRDRSVLEHYFGRAQWCLPTEDIYCNVIKTKCPNHFLRPYEELRREYEDLRRPFNVTAKVPYTDVWTYPTVSYYEGKHPCEKPIAMLEHIITASSREGALVLDSFGGSGSSVQAAINTNRNYLCIEKDDHYFQVMSDRIANHTKQLSLEVAA